MKERNSRHPRTGGDVSAEYEADQAEAQGKWDAFNQVFVTDNGIAQKIMSDLWDENFTPEPETSQEEVDAHHEYERKSDELLY